MHGREDLLRPHVDVGRKRGKVDLLALGTRTVAVGREYPLYQRITESK
jgi:hypothetical protein